MLSGKRMPDGKVEGVTKALLPLTDTLHTPFPTNRKFSFKLKRWQVVEKVRFLMPESM